MAGAGRESTEQWRAPSAQELEQQLKAAQARRGSVDAAGNPYMRVKAVKKLGADSVPRQHEVSWVRLLSLAQPPPVQMPEPRVFWLTQRVGAGSRRS